MVILQCAAEKRATGGISHKISSHSDLGSKHSSKLTFQNFSRGARGG